MSSALIELLRTPRSGEPLELHAFENDADGAREGILVAPQSGKAYPIVAGVPVMLEGRFDDGFVRKHARAIARLSQAACVSASPKGAGRWSFSDEWGYHQEANLEKTWEWTVEERLRQLLIETDLDASACRGKLILDAGCGNGQLSNALAQMGATVVGMDFSTSVFGARRRTALPGAYFVQGDLQSPPFAPETFDVIVSNGVMHHTPSTHATFVEVAKLVKPGGRLYLWLYRKPAGFFKRYLFSTAVDSVRSVVSRLPAAAQGVAVRAYAAAELIAHGALRRSKRRYSWHERVVDAYDSITPRWRHYHTPIEVSAWFFENGFSRAMLTHWDNPFGFGMVARKEPQGDTPGVNFGKRDVSRRYGA